MGLDLSASPVRLNSPAVRLIQVDAQAWEFASLHPPFTSPSPYDEPLPDVSRELLATLPEGFGIARPYPDRSYGQAEYLLDPAGYRALTGWPERERSLPYRIIEGDRPFADHATGGQGVPWRCSTASFLAEAAATIDAIDVAAARQEFFVADMWALGVYKVSQTERDDEAFKRVLNNLRQLARYYHRLVEHGLDLIIEKD
ncbi:hypothetical protein GCM10022226_66210 [Sphaerisporangium flaviroseum]|uniref:DUF1877 domain-containing protein n=1 Tax=Sphaerisporangium flaviroseum TaxID=509199 RepID=A0ABP7J718_9ACTN